MSTPLVIICTVGPLSKASIPSIPRPRHRLDRPTPTVRWRWIPRPVLTGSPSCCKHMGEFTAHHTLDPSGGTSQQPPRPSCIRLALFLHRQVPHSLHAVVLHSSLDMICSNALCLQPLRPLQLPLYERSRPSSCFCAVPNPTAMLCPAAPPGVAEGGPAPHSPTAS